MAATNADVIGMQKEVVRPKLQELFETTNGVGQLFKRAGESFKVSTWALGGTVPIGAFRAPLMQYDGGDWGVVNLDEGDMGRGSSMKIQYFTGSIYTRRLAIEMSQLAMDATATNEQAVANLFREQMKRTIKRAQAYYDTDLHQDGSGVIASGSGTGSPTNTNPTYNLEPNFGAQRLTYNQPVDVWDTTLASLKGTALRVNTIDFVNKTVNLTGTVGGAGAVNTDKLVINGVASPSTFSYSPGIYTYQSSSTSGSTLGLARNTVVEIVTPNVAANTLALTSLFGLQLKDQIIQRRDQENISNFRGLAHMAQRAAWYTTGIGISEWHRGDNDKMIDIMPRDTDYDTTFQYCGVTHMVDKKQDRTRIDWVKPALWGRIVLFEPKWHESPEGKRFFEVRIQTTGNVAAGWVEYFLLGESIISFDPGCAGYISSLGIPSGY